MKIVRIAIAALMLVGAGLPATARADGDTQAPTTTIEQNTTFGDPVSTPIVLGAVIGGSSVDDQSDVVDVTVEFTSPLSPTVSKHAQRLSLGLNVIWQTCSPPGPGVWIARAFATDSAGNVEQKGAQAIVVNPLGVPVPVDCDF